MNILQSIIHTLNKEEQRYFKIYISRMNYGEDRKDISLLILKIGNKIVVEGSHSYKVHIFDDRSSYAPKLYAKTYDCELIRLKAVDGLTRAHTGYWQDWVLRNL